jgi:hypothetical protein
VYRVFAINRGGVRSVVFFSLRKFMLHLFRQPSISEVVAKELAEARHALLAAQTARDYAQAMVEYNIQRIKRLECNKEDK